VKKGTIPEKIGKRARLNIADADFSSRDTETISSLRPSFRQPC